MSIEQDLRARLTTAMKARDSRTSDVLRMIMTKIMERRTSKGFTGEMTDAIALECIAAYRKTLAKAREEYAVLTGPQIQTKLDELDWEMKLCEEFLPKQASDAELDAVVAAALKEMAVTDIKQVGKVVGAVMKTHKGLADAARVKAIAERLLGSA